MPYAEFNDDFFAVEEAIGRWLSNESNLGMFDADKPPEWIGTISFIIEGEKNGYRVRLPCQGLIMIHGKLARRD